MGDRCGEIVFRSVAGSLNASVHSVSAPSCRYRKHDRSTNEAYGAKPGWKCLGCMKMTSVHVDDVGQ